MATKSGQRMQSIGHSTGASMRCLKAGPIARLERSPLGNFARPSGKTLALSVFFAAVLFSLHPAVTAGIGDA